MHAYRAFTTLSNNSSLGLNFVVIVSSIVVPSAAFPIDNSLSIDVSTVGASPLMSESAANKLRGE